MQDLDIIQRQNAAAVERCVPSQLAAGKHAILIYDGLRFTGASFHNSEPEAESVLQKLSRRALPGERFELRSPGHGA